MQLNKELNKYFNFISYLKYNFSNLLIYNRQLNSKLQPKSKTQTCRNQVLPFWWLKRIIDVQLGGSQKYNIDKKIKEIENSLYSGSYNKVISYS